MDERPLLEVRNLVKRFGGITATNRLSLQVAPSTTHALIGPNGAGKTTLIAQLQGELSPDGGDIYFRGQKITRKPAFRRAALGIARTFQITSVFADFTSFENVATAAQVREGHSFRFLRRPFRDSALRDRCHAALKQVNLDARAGVVARNLSSGERRQLELAMALAMRPSLLLLDEPLAGMGRSDSVLIVDLLQQLKERFTILLVEHDMNAVFALADRVTVLVGGADIATGSPADVRENPAVRAAYLGNKRTIDHAS